MKKGCIWLVMGVVVWSGVAHADGEPCPGGKVFRPDRASEPACLPVAVYNYLWCLERSGGGKVVAVQSTDGSTKSADQVKLDIKGKGVIVSAGGMGEYNRAREKADIKTVATAYGANLPKICERLADRPTTVQPSIPAPGHTKPKSPRPDDEIIQSGFGTDIYVSDRVKQPTCFTDVRGAALLVENNDPHLVCFYGMDTAGYFLSDNVNIEVKVRYLAGPTDQPFGLSFGGASSADARFRDAHHFYLRADGIYLVMVTSKNGQEMKQIASSRDPIIRIGRDAENTLRIEIRGKTVTYGINGKTVGSYTVDSEVRGFIAFDAQIDGGIPGLKVEFTDLIVSTPSVVAAVARKKHR